MTNTTSRRSARSRTRLIAFVCALMLNLTIIGSAFAAEIANGDFSVELHNYEICTSSGWQTTGSVGVDTQQDYGISSSFLDGCVARVFATSALGGTNLSTLSQTFSVPTTGVPHLSLGIYTSTSGIVLSNPQTITVYNSSGGVIYSKSRNSDDEQFFLCVNLDAYSGHNVTLEVKTSLTVSAMSRTAALYVDNAQFTPGCIWPSASFGW